MLRVELSRYRVKPGKSERVDEWMRMLNDRLDECLASFDRERMHVEAIFREKVEDEEFLYWFSVQGEGGEEVNTSDHDLDIEHLKFWRECIDPTYNPPHRSVDLDLQVSMIPGYLLEAMEREDARRSTEKESPPSNKAR